MSGYQSTKTSYATTESSFKADNTASNRCGVTLMNNQVGYVVAQVMADKKDITIRELPSMIRVDGINKIDFTAMWGLDKLN